LADTTEQEAGMAISADLGENLEKVVTDLVENGRYNSKSEVLREGVRLVQEREARLRELDAKIQAGLDDVEAGRMKPLEEVFERLEAKYEAMAKAQD
jgi:antitoxin ParD1/3/4